MIVLHLFTILLFLQPLVAEDRQWIPVPRRPRFSYDLESKPLEITTDSRLGSVVDIELYHEVGDYSIQLQKITENSPFVLLVAHPMVEYIQGFDLTGPVHEWKITKTAEQLQISCDGFTKSFNFTAGDEDTLKRQVTDLKFMPGDTATTQYKDFSGQFQTLSRILLDSRINLYPLEFKTQDAKAKKQQTHIRLFTSDLAIETRVDIRWDHDDYQFWIVECNRCDLDDINPTYAAKLFSNVPPETDKTWKLELTPYTLNINCNDVLVYSYIYNDENNYSNPKCKGCTAHMNMNFVHFQFNELNDNAAVEYLAPPSCTALPGSWAGVGVVEPSLPVPYNTPVSVTCSSGYNLTSGDTEIRCLGEDIFEFNTQPVCRKDCKDCEDDGKDDGKCDDDCKGENDKQIRNKYLAVGLGSGFAIGLVVALGVFCIRKNLMTESPRGNNIGAAYAVKNESANISDKW